MYFSNVRGLNFGEGYNYPDFLTAAFSDLPQSLQTKSTAQGLPYTGT
jgi:hypothetical protein